MTKHIVRKPETVWIRHNQNSKESCHSYSEIMELTKPFLSEEEDWNNLEDKERKWNIGSKIIKWLQHAAICKNCLEQFYENPMDLEAFTLTGDLPDDIEEADLDEAESWLFSYKLGKERDYDDLPKLYLGKEINCSPLWLFDRACLYQKHGNDREIAKSLAKKFSDERWEKMGYPEKREATFNEAEFVLQKHENSKSDEERGMWAVYGIFLWQGMRYTDRIYIAQDIPKSTEEDRNAVMTMASEKTRHLLSLFFENSKNEETWSLLPFFESGVANNLDNHLKNLFHIIQGNNKETTIDDVAAFATAWKDFSKIIPKIHSSNGLYDGNLLKPWDFIERAIESYPEVTSSVLVETYKAKCPAHKLGLMENKWIWLGGAIEKILHNISDLKELLAEILSCNEMSVSEIMGSLENLDQDGEIFKRLGNVFFGKHFHSSSWEDSSMARLMYKTAIKKDPGIFIHERARKKLNLP